jgi:hypothetical protein
MFNIHTLTYRYSMLGYDSVNIVSVATFPEELLVSIFRSLATIFRVDGGSRLLWNNCNFQPSCTMSHPVPNVSSDRRENLKFHLALYLHLYE